MFRVAESPDLDAVLFYVPIAQGVITKRSQTIIPYTDNRPTSTNHVQVCIALIRKMVQPQQISLDETLKKFLSRLSVIECIMLLISDHYC